MDADALVAEVAKRHGVALSRDDPVMILATLNELLAEENAKAQAEILAKFQVELASTFTNLTREAKAQIQAAVRQTLEANRDALSRVAVQELKQIEEMRKADGSDIEHAITQLKWILVINMTAWVMTLASVLSGFLL